MKRVGVDVGGTFTDLILVDEEEGRITVDKVPSTPDDPVAQRRRGRAGAVREGRRGARGRRQPPARDDRRDQHRAHAQRCGGRDDHDARLPGHRPHRQAQEAVQLLAPAGAALAVAAARQAAPPADREGAGDGAGRRRAGRARRRRGARARAGAEAGRRRVRRGLPAALVPQPRARAPHQGDRARGVPRGVPVRLARGAAPLPRVRAVLDGGPERVRRPEGLALRGALRRGPAGDRLHPRGAADAVLGRHGDGRGGAGAAGEPADVRAGGRPRRRDLGGRGWRATRTSSRSTWAAPPPTSASPPAAGCACATCSTRRSATTRRWCRWSTSTRSARAEARSPTWTRAASSASARSRRGPIPGRPATAVAATSPRRRTRSSCSGGCGRTEGCSAATCRSTSSSRPRRWQRVSDRLGVPVEEAALGALQVQKFSMAQAIEVNSVRRGYDPREFTLVAAGGAGPLFACDIAVELEIPRVLVPPHPGITSATGLLATDLQHEFVATERHFLRSLDRDRLGARLDELAAQAVAQLERDGVPEDRRLVRRLADCRYVGPGLRGPLRHPRGRARRRLGRPARGRVPRRARARVRAPVRCRGRDRQRPRARDRADSGAPVGRARGR